MKKVLIVEDDQDIVNLLKIHLKDMECQVDMALDGESGLQKAISNTYDLMILDLMLPKVEGMEICRRVRAKEIATPILMLTAKSEEIDKVLGLETGADDYMTKPFSVREFIARVKAIFRRTNMLKQQGNQKVQQLLTFANLQIDTDKHKVSLNDQRIDLSPKEYELLTLMASKPGKSYSRQQLLNLIWGYDFEGYEHTVNSHINRLRSKIEKDLANPKFILTTWGIGYRFSEEV